MLFLLFRKSLLLIFVLAFVGCSKNDNSRNPKTIGLTQIASHPSLDAVAKGVREGLKDLGWTDEGNLRIIFRNANRDPNLTLPIAESFVKQNVDLIVPISTPSAIAAKKATSKIPIVFVGVSDPIGVGLIKNYDNPGENITGSSDQWPFEQQIDLFLKLQPQLKTLALLYSPGDDVSLIALEKLRSLQGEKGFKLIARPISSAADVYSAARQMLLTADAIYTGTDNLIVENLSSVIKAANEAKKPVYAGDEGSVEKGALATFSISMYDLGYESAKLIDRVLRGESPNSIPVMIVRSGNVIINRKALARLRMTIPSEIKIARFIEE